MVEGGRESASWIVLMRCNFNRPADTQQPRGCMVALWAVISLWACVLSVRGQGGVAQTTCQVLCSQHGCVNHCSTRNLTSLPSTHTRSHTHTHSQTHSHTRREPQSAIRVCKLLPFCLSVCLPVYLFTCPSVLDSVKQCVIVWF